jgi:hypothetical protein
MREWLRRLLLDRWRTIRAVDLDYGAIGDDAYILVYRGWRRRVEIVTTRDEALTLAEMIRHAEQPATTQTETEGP